MAKNNPSAKTKYPKKFRQKLEKIADGMQNGGVLPGNIGLEQPSDDDGGLDFTKTFYHTFLPRNSVEGMHAVLDEEIGRVNMHYYLRTPGRVHRITRPAPWGNAEPDAST